jgi:putative flavoprotein involved in K+ transport
VDVTGHELSLDLDILVIGASQAGLALGFHLRKTPFRFQIVDRNVRVGDSWRKRFESLVLFTPRAYSALPGLAVPGDPDGYPTKDELADYLEMYVNHFDLPVVSGLGIRRLERGDGGFRAITDTGQPIDCRAVVLATGAFQRPAIPAIAKQLSQEVLQLSPEDYKAPGQLPPGRVLVVGDGATGREIALELAATHQVLLATGHHRRVSPDRILGKSVFWWMDRLGILRASRESAIGRYLMKTDPFPGKALELSRLREQGVVVVGRIVRAEGTKVDFAGGESTEIDAVVWATGYRDDTDWVAIPEVKDERGRFVHQRGISPVPNLYFIGRSWQWTRGSALLVGVGADAAYLAEHIVKHLAESTVA